MKEPLISYDWKNKLWHIMVEFDYVKDYHIASCHTNSYHNWNPGKSHIGYNPKLKSLMYDKFIPYKFGFDYVCKKCLRLEKVNIEEFKVWLVIQKLKYL